MVLTQLRLLTSNFGQYAGLGATNAQIQISFGTSVGYGATDAYQSTFIGTSAGFQATNAYNSNFFIKCWFWCNNR
jgi:hypothetical protein